MANNYLGNTGLTELVSLIAEKESDSFNVEYTELSMNNSSWANDYHNRLMHANLLKNPTFVGDPNDPDTFHWYSNVPSSTAVQMPFNVQNHSVFGPYGVIGTLTNATNVITDVRLSVANYYTLSFWLGGNASWNIVLPMTSGSYSVNGGNMDNSERMGNSINITTNRGSDYTYYTVHFYVNAVENTTTQYLSFLTDGIEGYLTMPKLELGNTATAFTQGSIEPIFTYFSTQVSNLERDLSKSIAEVSYNYVANFEINTSSTANIQMAFSVANSNSVYEANGEEYSGSTNIQSIRSTSHTFKVSGEKWQNIVNFSAYMSGGSVTSVSSINIHDMTWPNVQISELANGCTNLSEFHTCPATITNAVDVFRNCQNITSLSDLKKWNMNAVTNISGICQNCTNLTSVEFVNYWNLRSVVNARNAFANANLSGKYVLDFGDALDVASDMFYNTGSIISNRGTVMIAVESNNAYSVIYSAMGNTTLSESWGVELFSNISDMEKA